MSPIRPTISSCGADGCLIPPHKGFNYSPRLIDESTEPRPGGGGGERAAREPRGPSGFGRHTDGSERLLLLIPSF